MIKKSSAKIVKKSVLTRKKALAAAKAVKREFANKPGGMPAAWKKGGREWARVLSHFGARTPSSNK